jgi:hypothetical protein
MTPIKMTTRMENMTMEMRTPIILRSQALLNFHLREAQIILRALKTLVNSISLSA